MVNFRDPAVVAQNVREYYFPAKIVSPKSLLTPSTVAGERFWHALAGLYL